jgi:iduronate 2-sulfatase
MDNSINTGNRQITKTERESLIAGYDSGIAYLDAEIGKVLDRLRASGIYENTFIIVTSDHGEAFGEHNLIGHTVTSVFQDGAHIPLLVKFPGQHEGQRSSALVSQVDLLPTVLDIAGYPAPAGLQGRSLRSPRAGSDFVFSEAHAIGEHDRSIRMRGVRRAAFTASAKLIMWSSGPPEFYNLTIDPGESQNRYDPNDPVVASLQNSLATWAATMPKQLSKPTKMDKETVDRIRSLGYIQK